jgi:hypothetical protein
MYMRTRRGASNEDVRLSAHAEELVARMMQQEKRNRP